MYDFVVILEHVVMLVEIYYEMKIDTIATEP